MKRLHFSLFFLLVLVFTTNAQVFRTQPLSDEIYTIQVNADGNWQQLPIIQLNGNSYIRINFDRLGDNSSNTLRYSIIHCNADWTKSSLSDIEYLDGFNNILIDDYAESMNTTVDYTNFNIEIPNDRQKLKLSGNYVVLVYDTSDPNKILLQACFSILDSQISLSGNASSNTDIDVDKKHQQVTFTIDYLNLPIRDPFTDLKIFVRQNNRIDNQVSDLKPTYIQGSKLLYEHNNKLIYEAGNEYRRFESVSYRYNGLNMLNTQYIGSKYYANIESGKIRSNRTYVYDQDQNGRYIIRNAEAQSGESDIEADYFITNFTLLADDPLIEPLFLNGELTYDLFDDKYEMKYDYDDKEYKGSLLLKQGLYNYQYLAKDGTKYTTEPIEGDYYETKNEYTIYVYYKPLGSRSDLLVGILSIIAK